MIVIMVILVVARLFSLVSNYVLWFVPGGGIQSLVSKTKTVQGKVGVAVSIKVRAAGFKRQHLQSVPFDPTVHRIHTNVGSLER